VSGLSSVYMIQDGENPQNKVKKEEDKNNTFLLVKIFSVHGIKVAIYTR